MKTTLKLTNRQSIKKISRLSALIILTFFTNNIVIAQSNTTTTIENQVISKNDFEEIWDWYGRKNYAIYADVNDLENTPKEVLDDVIDEWLNIGSGYLSKDKHWHKEDRSDITFDNFINSLYFFKADSEFSSVTAVCKNHGRQILISSARGQFMDINQGPYSITLWDYYNTVAIKSGGEKFISHSKPILFRWNDSVSEALINEILETGKVELYVEPNLYRVDGIMRSKQEKTEYEIPPNLNIKANIKIENIEDVRECFKNKKPSGLD